MPARQIFSFCTLFLSFLFHSAAFGDQPEEAAEAFYEHLRGGDYTEAASLFDPDELRSFRDLLRIIYENPRESDVQQLKALFGPDVTAEKLNSMSDAEFFSTFLSLIFQQLFATGSFSLDGIDVIGAVHEDDMHAHVVIRQRLGIEQRSIEMMDVVSMRLVQGHWKLQMKADTKALAEQIRQTFVGQ